tara:strand:+ start:482 stop:613 length:132 start_codon:yes stop_codon:yes gene_type:complete
VRTIKNVTKGGSTMIEKTGIDPVGHAMGPLGEKPSYIANIWLA